MNRRERSFVVLENYLLLAASLLMLLGELGVRAQQEQRQQQRIVCPRVVATDKSTSLQASDPGKKDFTEVSGLGFSPTLVGPSGQPLVYAVNDSGGGRRMGIFDSGTGERLKSLRMPRSLDLALDYESMTVGSCGVSDGDCIYIADVGDNTARGSGGSRSGHDREAYPIYKVREPKIDDYEDNAILPESEVTTLWFTYSHPTSPTAFADCEATFLDNVGWGDDGAVGDFYIVTKWDDYGDNTANTLNRLFVIPAQAWTEAESNATFIFSPAAVGSYENGRNSNALMGYQWTRGEMTLDGTLIALGDYYDQYLFLRCPGMSVAQALAVSGTQHCETWPIDDWDTQHETIAWAPDKLKTLEVSECYGSYCNPDPPMVWTEMDYTFAPDNSIACPLEDDVSVTTPSPPTLEPSLLPQSSETPLPSTNAPTLPVQPTRAPEIPSQPPTMPTEVSPTAIAGDSTGTITSGGTNSNSNAINILSLLIVASHIWGGRIT